MFDLSKDVSHYAMQQALCFLHYRRDTPGLSLGTVNPFLKSTKPLNKDPLTGALPRMENVEDVKRYTDREIGRFSEASMEHII